MNKRLRTCMPICSIPIQLFDTPSIVIPTLCPIFQPTQILHGIERCAMCRFPNHRARVSYLYLHRRHHTQVVPNHATERREAIHTYAFRSRLYPIMPQPRVIRRRRVSSQNHEQEFQPYRRSRSRFTYECAISTYTSTTRRKYVEQYVIVS
ncbi:hypothetical protein BDQ17DRAFT_1369564 [Cyathus striatus]|nr:hypothetical protein BDQ17DRAFT_1369564 [Cyathus striatus]